MEDGHTGLYMDLAQHLVVREPRQGQDTAPTQHHLIMELTAWVTLLRPWTVMVILNTAQVGTSYSQNNITNHTWFGHSPWFEERSCFLDRL